MSIHDQDKIIEGEKRGIRIGRKEGRKEGMNANKISNAGNLLAMNILTHEQIAQAVELPLEKIKELAREMETANIPTSNTTTEQEQP